MKTKVTNVNRSNDKNNNDNSDNDDDCGDTNDNKKTATINLIYLVQVDTREILTALYIVIQFI